MVGPSGPAERFLADLGAGPLQGLRPLPAVLVQSSSPASGAGQPCVRVSGVQLQTWRRDLLLCREVVRLTPKVP